MNPKYDFLTQPTNDRIKQEINNICDSYSHPWDILSELIQNSIDAIRRKNNYQETNTIEIIINSKTRSIEVKDSGTGIVSDHLPNLLSPHSTDKMNKNDEIGNKGVGLTYCIFTSNYFKISSKSKNSFISAQIKNACLWKKNISEEIPQIEILEEYKTENAQTFTSIVLTDVEKVYEDEIDIFHQNFDCIKFILRTKTAIGNTNSIWGKDCDNIKIILRYIDINNQIFDDNDLIFKYLLPLEFLDKKSYLEESELKNLILMLNDNRRREKLIGKTVYKKGSIERTSRNINYFAMFVPSRDVWTKINQKNTFAQNEEDEYYIIKEGIFLISKGMPTGISLIPPLTGKTGYWSNLFIILEDNSLKFDLGRKSIPGPTQKMLKDIANSLFSELTKWVSYTSTRKTPELRDNLLSFQRTYLNNQFEDLKNRIPDLNNHDINFLKEPDGQEAGVAAIFHEMLGKNILKGYHCYKSGYKENYDFWGHYKINTEDIGENQRKSVNSLVFESDLVIEFKYNAASILNDAEDNKHLSEIDLIVCWEIDTQLFRNKNVNVEVVNKDDVLFHGTNYILEWPSSEDLGAASTKYVIALKNLIDELERNN